MTTATVTLTPDQVASVVSQAAGSPAPPNPTPQPPVVPITTPPAASPDQFPMHFDWASPGAHPTGPIADNLIVVASFNAGNIPMPSNFLASILATEYGSGPVQRVGCLSDQPGSFVPLKDKDGKPFEGASVPGTTVTVPFQVVDEVTTGYYPQVLKGQLVYFNVKISNPQSSTLLMIPAPTMISLAHGGAF